MSSTPNPSSIMHPNPLAPAAPVPSIGKRYQATANDGTATDAAVLPLTSVGWLKTEILPCEGEAWLAAELHYDASAASTTGFPLLRAYVSNANSAKFGGVTAPALSDDVWVGLPMFDGSLTATALGSSPAVGPGTAGPLEGFQKIYNQTMQGEAAVANSDKTRQGIVLNVRAWRWVVFAISEGTGANPGKARLYVTGVI